MAILHIESASSPRRWFVLCSTAVAMGAALGAGAMLLDDAPGASRNGTASPASSCCDAAAAPAASMHAPSTLATTQPPQGDAASKAARAAQQLRQALLYDECQKMAQLDRESAEGAPIEADQRFEIDPSGAFAAQIDREERARREPCLRVGPHEYRQIDTLMREAAQLGHTDAKFFLLESEVRGQLDRMAAASEEDPPPARAPMAAALAEVEALALAGHRQAMSFAAQLLAAGPTGAPQPVRAAAWNLVTLQLERAEPLSDDDVAESGVLASLSPEEAEQALRDAAALRSTCCRR